MGKLSRLGRVLSSGFIVMPILAVMGILLGALVVFCVFPGKPQVGIIDIPFTVISEDSAFVISEYLSYARKEDSIKAVVIKLSTPGGGAASSERRYIETRKLRQKKPVVMVMDSLVASGGYMMAMGTNHTYAQTSSLVGNVGVISFAGPLIPPIPDESMIVTGPFKLSGASRREWFGNMDQLKQSFAQMVISERGDKLNISRNELLQGRIYPGLEAVRLGLVDEIGGDSQAIDKAASLAGINNYGFVNVNMEVERNFVQAIRRIFASADDGESGSDLVDTMTILAMTPDKRGSLLNDSNGGSLEISNDIERLQSVRRMLLSSRLGSTQENPLPGFPLEISQPNVYYLYVGQNP